MPKTVNLTTISSDIKRSIAKGTLATDAQNIHQEILKTLQQKIKDSLFQLLPNFSLENKLAELKTLNKNNLEILEAYSQLVEKNIDNSKTIEQFEVEKTRLETEKTRLETEKTRLETEKTLLTEQNANLTTMLELPDIFADDVHEHIQSINQQIQTNTLQIKEKTDNIKTNTLKTKEKTDGVQKIDEVISLLRKLRNLPSIDENSNFDQITQRIQSLLENNKKIATELLALNALQQFLKTPTITLINEFKSHPKLFGERTELNHYLDSSEKLLSKLENPVKSDEVLAAIKLFDETEQSPYLSYEAKNEVHDQNQALEKYLESLGDKCAATPSNAARLEFFKFLNKQPVDRDTGTEKSMEQLLGKEGVVLFKNALKEEIESKEFQTEYFHKSLSTYEGQRPKENWDVLILSGVSGAGKTSTGHYEINQMYPKNETDPEKNFKFNLVWIDGGLPREISRVQMALKRFIEAHGCNLTDMYKESKAIQDPLKKRLQKFVRSNPDKVDGMVITETFTENWKFNVTSNKLEKNLKKIDAALNPEKKLIVSAALVTGEDNTKFEQTNKQMIQSRATMNDEQKEKNLNVRGLKLGLLDTDSNTIQSDFTGQAHKEYKENSSVGLSSYGPGLGYSQRFMLDMMDTATNQVFILNDLRRYNDENQEVTTDVNSVSQDYIASDRVHKIWKESASQIPFQTFANNTRKIFFSNLEQNTQEKMTAFKEEQNPELQKTYDLLMQHYRKEIIKEHLAQIYNMKEDPVNELDKQSFINNKLKEFFKLGDEHAKTEFVKGLGLAENPKLLETFIPSDEEVFQYARKQLESYRVRVDKHSDAASYPFYVSLYNQFKKASGHEVDIIKSSDAEKLKSANQPYLLKLFRVLNETDSSNYYSCTQALQRVEEILAEKKQHSKTASKAEVGKTIKILQMAKKYFEGQIYTLSSSKLNTVSFSTSKLTGKVPEEKSNLDELIRQNTTEDNKKLKKQFNDYSNGKSVIEKQIALKSWLETYEEGKSKGSVSKFYQQLNPSAQKQINHLSIDDPLNIALNKVLMQLDGESYKSILDKYIDFLNAENMTEKNAKFTALILEMMTPRGWFDGRFNNTKTIQILRNELGKNSYLIDELLNKSLDYPMLKMIHEVGSSVDKVVLKEFYDQMSKNPSDGLKNFVAKLHEIEKDEEFFNQLSNQQKIVFHCQIGSHFVKELVKQEVDEKILASVCQTSTISPAMRYEVLQKLEHASKATKEISLEPLKQAHFKDLGNEFKEYNEFLEIENVTPIIAKTWVLKKTKNEEWANDGKSLKNLAKAMSYLPDNETTVFVKNMLENISLYQLYDNAGDNTVELDKVCQNPSGVKSIQLMSNLQLVNKSSQSASPPSSDVGISGQTIVKQKSTLNPVVLDKPIKVKKGEDGIAFTIEQPPKTSNIKVSCTKEDFDKAEGKDKSFEPEQVDVMVTMVQTLLLNWKKGKMIQLNVENDAQARAMYYTCMLLSDKLKSWDKDRFGSFDMNSVIIRQGGKVHNLSKAKEDIEKHQKRFFKTEIGELTKIQQSFEGAHESEMKTAYQSMLTREDEKMIQQFDDEVQKLISSMGNMSKKNQEGLYKETFFKYKQKLQDLSEKALDKLETHMKGRIKGG